MSAWKIEGVFSGFGDEKILGVKLWDYKWKFLGQFEIIIPNISFPEKTYLKDVYEITLPDKSVKFAAEEISMNVWKIYVPA